MLRERIPLGLDDDEEDVGSDASAPDDSEPAGSESVTSGADASEPEGDTAGSGGVDHGQAPVAGGPEEAPGMDEHETIDEQDDRS